MLDPWDFLDLGALPGATGGAAGAAAFSGPLECVCALWTDVHIHMCQDRLGKAASSNGLLI